MKAWRADKFGDAIGELKMVDIDLPEPMDGVIEIQIDAAGVGLPDVLAVRGTYPAVQKPPVTPGQEVVGTITRIGPNCTVNVGDKVISSTLFAQGYGGFAEYCLASTHSALPIPKGMPDEQAAGFYIPYHTGYVGVIQRGQLQAGETMLVLGGAGSSGSAAIQLGKVVGATVIATASSDDKAKFCTELGADHVINYHEQAIHHAVRDITDGNGVNLVYDPVGGKAYEQATKCMARHGRLILIGYSSGEWPKVDPLHAILRSYSLIGAFPGARDLDETKAQHATLVEWAEAGKIKVPVDKVFPFDQVPQALDRVARSEMLGKVIVKI